MAGLGLWEGSRTADLVLNDAGGSFLAIHTSNSGGRRQRSGFVSKAVRSNKRRSSELERYLHSARRALLYDMPVVTSCVCNSGWARGSSCARGDRWRGGQVKSTNRAYLSSYTSLQVLLYIQIIMEPCEPNSEVGSGLREANCVCLILHIAGGTQIRPNPHRIVQIALGGRVRAARGRRGWPRTQAKSSITHVFATKPEFDLETGCELREGDAVGYPLKSRSGKRTYLRIFASMRTITRVLDRIPELYFGSSVRFDLGEANGVGTAAESGHAKVREFEAGVAEWAARGRGVGCGRKGSNEREKGATANGAASSGTNPGISMTSMGRAGEGAAVHGVQVAIGAGQRVRPRGPEQRRQEGADGAARRCRRHSRPQADADSEMEAGCRRA
ncbi:hypothetical protein AURDEDRAFT_126043 [Auricularia subglabra TFB-10046 SS5]|nr:hypothetical protein AURDEDRAFT_126043 [Auricularia subglabra TFB-10046 SS5]